MTLRLRLVKDLDARIRAGHPWIYRDALASGGGRAGEIVEVVGRGGDLLARGFYDPDSPIAVRVLATEAIIDDELIRARVASACRLRHVAGIDADGLRLLHGEGDFVPGLVLDAYAGTGVARFDGEACAAFWRPRIRVVAEACADAGFPLARVWGRAPGRGGAGSVLVGDAPPSDGVVMREGAAAFEVDVVHGQKTGFFLDQRDNRALVGGMAAGLDVLNLFSYTGGFSVLAALGGAHRVTSVDLAAPAIEAGRRNFRRNELEGEHVVADVFEFLERSAGRAWDLVICDPPSFAPSAKALPNALAAYRRLNAAAAKAVAPGGLLASASCSSHVDPPAFLDAVHGGLRAAGREGKVIAVRGAGADHPTLPAFPEGRYLKFLLVAVG